VLIVLVVPVELVVLGVMEVVLLVVKLVALEELWLIEVSPERDDVVVDKIVVVVGELIDVVTDTVVNVTVES
jgi:hypothetical protein